MSWWVRIDFWGRYSILIRPIFAWYDFWVGAYFDREKRRLYVLPLPCVGVVIESGESG